MKNPEYVPPFFFILIFFFINAHSLPEFLGKKVEEEDITSVNDSLYIYNLSSV